MKFLRNQQPTTRDILTQVDITKRTKSEHWHLNQYRDRLQKLSEVESQLEAMQARFKELEAGSKKDPTIDLRIQTKKHSVESCR